MFSYAAESSSNQLQDRKLEHLKAPENMKSRQKAGGSHRLKEWVAGGEMRIRIGGQGSGGRFESQNRVWARPEVRGGHITCLRKEGPGRRKALSL